jgi:hypothetical protein
MVWDEFTERAYSHFDKPRNNVRLGYRVKGDTGAMSHLTCAYDWEYALDCVKERVIAACTRAVCMELRDMVSGRLFEMEKKTHSGSRIAAQRRPAALGKGRGSAPVMKIYPHSHRQRFNINLTAWTSYRGICCAIRTRRE